MKELLQSLISFNGDVKWMENVVCVNGEMLGFGYLICLYWELIKQAGHGKLCFIYTLGGQDAIFNTRRSS